MMWLWIALGTLLAGTGVVLHEKSKTGTISPPLIGPSRFDGLLPDHTYRVWAKLKSGYGEAADIEALEQDLSAKIRSLGFSEVMLANEDPTDPHVWTFIAKWGGGASEATGGENVPPLSIYSTEELTGLPSTVLYPSTPPVLDQSLSFAEANAVSVALAKETDPSKLFAFAKVMAGDFPVSQSLLNAKAGILVKPVTSQSKTSFQQVQQGGQEPITNVAASPMAKSALLDYYAKAGIVPGSG